MPSGPGPCIMLLLGFTPCTFTQALQAVLRAHSQLILLHTLVAMLLASPEQGHGQDRAQISGPQ